MAVARKTVYIIVRL